MAVAYRTGATIAHGIVAPYITVPATVANDDIAILLYSSTPSAMAGWTPPAGWSQLGSTVTIGSSLASALLYKKLTIADASTTVTFSQADTSKTTIDLAVYSGVDPTSPINTSALAAFSGGGVTHAAPAVTSTVTGYVVSGIADRASPGSTSFTPAVATKRVEQLGSGGGSVSAAIGDSAGNVTLGTVSGGNWTGTVNTATGVTFTVVLTPSGSSSLTASATAFQALLGHILNKRIDFDTDTIKMALVEGYTYDVTHDYFNDITGGGFQIAGVHGYTTGGQTLASPALNDDPTDKSMVFTSAGALWTPGAGETLTAEGAVIFMYTGTNSTSPLIAYLDFGGTVSATVSLAVDPDPTNGWLLFERTA